VGINHDKKPLFRDTWTNPRFEAGLNEVLSQTAPDLVHIHHLAHVGLTVTNQLRKAKIPYIITLHDHHLLCVRGQLLNREMERCVGPSKERCPVCISEHLAASQNLHKAAALAKLLGVRRVARKFFEKRAPSVEQISKWEQREQAARETLTGAACLLSPSIHLAERFRAFGFDVTVQDLPLLTSIERSSAPKTTATKFLYVGSLIPSKGPHVLLEAIKSLPNCSLNLWGPVQPYDSQPNWPTKIRELIESTPNAEYKGTFTDEDRSSVYAEAHVLVVPSIWEENSPLIVREGVAAGLHVIGTLGGGIGEIDPDATLVAPDDAIALRKALEHYSTPAQLRRKDKKEWPLEIHAQELEGRYALVLGK
jgi:glycosyltransferase involved in cell wall biosynthesis